MVFNYNDLLRRKISDCFNDNENVYEILDFFNNLTEGYQQLIIELALTDLYKLSYYIDGKPSKLCEYSIQEVIEKCTIDTGLIIDLMLSVKLFNEMDYVSKTLLMEVIEQNGHDRNVFSISKLHLLDKITYVIIDDIENYKQYYKEYLDINKDKSNKISIITEYISYRVLNLKYEDPNKYKKYIIEFIKVFYKWKKFIKHHEGEYLLNKSDIIYLDIIDSKSLLEIFEYIENNFDFLFTIIGEYLHYKTQKIEIKEEIVDEYLNSSSSDNLKQKLKIKEN